MSDKRIDTFAKLLNEAPSSRRSAVKMAAAAAVAIGGVRSADAAVCRPNQSICRKGGDCCSGFCSPPDKYGRSYCGPSKGDPCARVVCEDWEFCSEGICLSCFVAGTRVALADGSSKLIELVGLGDLVIGASGSVNRVIGIETPALGDRKLYAFNGGEPFVTAEHPFFTDSGWKSISPAATANENPRLPVGQLQPGDSLVELVEMLVPALVVGTEPIEVRTRSLPLQTLTASTSAPWTTVYNLLLDGDHTYFANDLLVHNKA